MYYKHIPHKLIKEQILKHTCFKTTNIRSQFRIDAELTRGIPILLQISNVIPITHSDSYHEVLSVLLRE